LTNKIDQIFAFIFRTPTTGAAWELWNINNKGQTTTIARYPSDFHIAAAAFAASFP
jgi:hypothetical protein